MVMMCMAGHALIQVAVRPIARLIFHLNRGVFNLVVMNQEMLNTLQQRVVIVRRDHLHMQRHDRFFTYHPDVYMMHIANFGDIPAEIALQGGNIQCKRSAFQ